MGLLLFDSLDKNLKSLEAVIYSFLRKQAQGNGYISNFLSSVALLDYYIVVTSFSQKDSAYL